MSSIMGVGFEITELRLGLPGGAGHPEKKRPFSEINSRGEKEEAKDTVVGWPPLCLYRVKEPSKVEIKPSKVEIKSSKAYVKVSMDGFPFLRKLDISSYRGYNDLLQAFDQLFEYPGLGDAIKAYHKSEILPIYQDEDGDWMLLGDDPWKMFVESCKRLRIMKKSEGKGIGLQSKKHKVTN